MSINGFDSYSLNMTGLNNIEADEINSDVIYTNELYVNGIQITNNYESTTINIGLTQTLPPGQNASVINIGTETNAIFNFGIPQGIQGIQGNQGIQGIQGLSGTNGTNGINGISFIYRYLYDSLINYEKNDVVSFNGSSYICINNCQNINPDSNTYYWFYLAVKGDQGEQGPRGWTGSTGSTGSQGPKGDKGDKGDSGSSPDVDTIILGVLTALGFAGTQAEILALASSVAGLTTAITTLSGEVDLLEGKTTYQSASIDNSTEFKSKLIVKNTLVDKIVLNPYGASSFSDDVDFNQNISISGNITSDVKMSNDLIVDGTIKTGSIHYVANDTIHTTIQSYPNLAGSGFDNLGTLNLKSDMTNIMSNNVEIGTPLANVIINGYVTMPLMDSLFGFKVTNGFINQEI